MRKGIGNREFVEWKANLLCISLSASAPWRMWGKTTSISCSAESGESLPVQRIPSNWEILENWLFQKHYTQCIMWIVTQQRFQRANFSPLIHASLYRWRAAALIHVLLSFFKLATLSLPRTLYCTSSLSPQHIDVRPLRMKYNQAEKIIMGTISFLCFEKVNAIKFDKTIFIN